MNGKVWLPESSLSDGKPSDTGNKERKKKGKIIRRTTPTVVLQPPRQGKNSRLDGSKSRNYSTIENSSYNRSSLHLVLSHRGTKNVQSSTSQLTCKKFPEFCGWETYGCQERHLQSSSTFTRCTAERTSLNTPADGHRSQLQSRACSRASGNRKKNIFYEFKHFTDTHSHLEDYCTQYSYSALTLSRQGNGTDALREASARLQEDIRRNQKKDVSLPKCLVKRHDEGGNTLYMQQLASRLGVGVMQSINEKQLRYRRPQPTPPSFTKKSRVADDLVVSSTQDEKSPLQEEECAMFTPLPQGGQSHHHDGESSRPLTGALSTVPDPLEFPKIMARLQTKNNKLLSTSSVTKYLTINRRTHPVGISLGLGEEESAMDFSSHGSITEEDAVEKAKPSTRNTALEVSLGKEVGERNCQPPAMMTDEGWRERILTQKAQALGLLSRDWTQAQLLKKAANTYDQQTHNMMKNHHMKGNSRSRTRADSRNDTRPTTRADYTRPTTRVGYTRPTMRADGTRPTMRDDTSRPSTRADATRRGDALRLTNKADSQRRHTTREDVKPNNQYKDEKGTSHITQPHTAESDSYKHSKETCDTNTTTQRTTYNTTVDRVSEKLKKMMNIYEPTSAASKTQSKRAPNRQQTYTRMRCETRLSRRPETRCGDVDNSRKIKQSRPSTRLGKKTHLVGTASKRPGLESDESQYWNEVPIMTHRPIPKFHTNVRMHVRASPHSIPIDDSNRLNQYSHTNKQRHRAQNSTWQARQNI